jgi:RNA polymerase sigma factor (sigma-70 family)
VISNKSFILSKTVRLDKEEIAQAVENKDWDLLVRSQIPLVVSIAKKYRDFDSAVSVGLMAVDKSVRRFVPGGRAGLTGFCRWKIDRELWKSLRGKVDAPVSDLVDKGYEQHWQIEVSDTTQRLVDCLTGRQKEVVVRSLQGMTHGEIASDLGLSVQYVRQTYSLAVARMRNLCLGKSII